MPIISIIVPVYNSEKYLHCCIDSILNQTFTDFELLLIDDGGFDRSGMICDKYAEKDSRVIVFHKDNGGANSARNLGIANARGEWITFVDSDDILYPEALSVLYSNSKGVEIVTAAIEQNRRIWKHSFLGVLDSEKYMKGLAKGDIYGYLYATLYHVSLFKHPRLLIPKSVKIGEDVLFKLDIARHVKNVVNIENVIYFYRTNSTSIMQSYHRSIWYYIRYFELRDKLISSELRLSLKSSDLHTLLDAFYNPYIPYRKKDYLYLKNLLANEILENIELPISDIRRIKLLKNEIKLVLYKYSHYNLNRIINILYGKPKNVVLD